MSGTVKISGKGGGVGELADSERPVRSGDTSGGVMFVVDSHRESGALRIL